MTVTHLMMDPERAERRYGMMVTWCGHTRPHILQTTTQPLAARCKLCLRSFEARTLNDDRANVKPRNRVFRNGL